MKEHELIELLTPRLPGNSKTIVGAGDDCAVLDMGITDRFLLFKTDAVVEGIHFTSESGWNRIGRKAISRCLSDIAAMAGTPTSALVTLGLPDNFDSTTVEDIYDGITERAKEFNVSISGGETVRTAEKLFLSISMVGWVPQTRLLLRRSMQVGDAIFVTGLLGGSLAGKHLDFTPRIVEAQWLAEHFDIHAMMDISDGLAGDIRRIMQASGTGVELLLEAIPISREAKQMAKKDGKTPLTHALSDGEDFELLLTLSANQAIQLRDAWAQQFPDLKLSCIGKAMNNGQCNIRSRKTGLSTLETDGYDHFK